MAPPEPPGRGPLVRLVPILGPLVAPLGRRLLDLLARRGVTPDALTALGTLVNGVAAGLFAAGHLRTAGWVTLAAGLFDLLDGALARHTGRASRFGAFLDSTLDRWSDGALLVGLMAHFAAAGRPGACAVAGAALVGAFVTSYARARAESLTDRTMKVGLLERPERVVLLAAAGVFRVPLLVAWLLAVLGHVTAVQRILWVRRVLREDAPAHASLAAREGAQ